LPSPAMPLLALPEVPLLLDDCSEERKALELIGEVLMAVVLQGHWPRVRVLSRRFLVVFITLTSAW